MFLFRILRSLGPLTLNLGEFKGHFAGRDVNFDDIADFVAEESRGEGRGDGNLSLLEVCLALGDDGVFLDHLILGIADGDDGEKEHLGGVDFRFIEETCIGNELLELGDTGLEVSLCLLGGVVFGVLGEVAFVACLSDRNSQKKRKKALI